MRKFQWVGHSSASNAYSAINSEANTNHEYIGETNLILQNHPHLIPSKIFRCWKIINTMNTISVACISYRQDVIRVILQIR